MTVLEDCVGAVDLMMQEGPLHSFRYGFGDVLKSDEFIAAIKARAVNVSSRLNEPNNFGGPPLRRDRSAHGEVTGARGFRAASNIRSHQRDGYGLVALGYHIVFRATQLIDFAQGEKAALGGLVALSLLTAIGDHPWLALLIVAVGGYVLGWAYERAILRPIYNRPPIVPIIATVGVAQFIYFGDGLIWGNSAVPFPYSFSGDPSGALTLGGLRIPIERLWVWVLVLLVVIACSLFFERSRRGQAMVAAADNQLGAQLSGINVAAMRSHAMSMATALAILGGH